MKDWKDKVMRAPSFPINQDELTKLLQAQLEACEEETEEKVKEIINQLQGIYNNAGDLRTMERQLRDFLYELRYIKPSNREPLKG